MTSFPDLAVCTYFPFFNGDVLRAIGWLERGQPFTTGKADPSVYMKLRELFANAWQPFASAGIHECSLCQFHGEARGHANLLVPNGSLVYICPDLITHYINAHYYRPPDEFCDAVLKCPDTRSMDYKRLLLASGGRSLIQQANST
jgi:hypothetical protein